MSNIIDSIQLSGVTYTLSAQTSGGGVTTGEVQTMIDESISGKTNQSDFTGHTADTTIHVTAQDKTNWNAKSDFSGSYNDLTNKLSAGTNVSIVDNVISAEGGGGKAIEAGRGISITTGATADTVSFNLPIYSGTGEGSIIGGFSGNTASGKYSIALGGRYESIFDYQYCKASGKGAISFGGTASGQGAFSCGENPQALGFASVAFGDSTKAIGVESFVIGRNTTANTFVSFAQGKYTKTTNEAEVALGEFNNSVSGSSTFGNSGNTLFSVGNGTADNARHNAFEIRQNGDIYLSSGGTDIKLQDHLGGGGASYSAGTGIDITNDVISVTGMVDTTTYSTYTAATDTALSNKQTTLTAGTGISIVDNVISATGGGGGGNVNVVELTQAQYDALTTIDPDAIYVITDAQGGDLSQYMTSAQTTSAITQATSDKVSTSAITTSITSSSTDAQIPSAKAVYDIVGDIETLLSQI